MIPKNVYEQIVPVYFAAMLHGFAGEKSDVRTNPSNGFEKMSNYFADPKDGFDERLSMQDNWWKIPDSTLSTGVATVFFSHTSAMRIPVWTIQYLGDYDKRAIPVLKAALRFAFVEKQFVGGRGPEEFRYCAMTYRNFPNRGQSTIERFSGYERVYDQDGRMIGEHSYQGGMLVPKPTV